MSVGKGKSSNNASGVDLGGDLTSSGKAKGGSAFGLGGDLTSSGKAKGGSAFASKGSNASSKSKGRESPGSVRTDAAASGNIFLRSTTAKRSQAVYY